MKRIILILSLLLLLIPAAANGQWKQTSGPEGGYFNTVYNYNSKLHAVTINGRIFRQESDDEWSFFSNGHYDLQRIYNSDGKLLAVTSTAIAYSDDGGINWERSQPEGYLSSAAFFDGQIYAALNDSIFVFNPQTNQLTYSGIKTNFNIQINGEWINVAFFGISSILINNGRVLIFAMIPQVTGMSGVFYTDDNGINWTQAQGITDEFSSRDLVKANNELYLNTFSGLYKSSDNGMTWSDAVAEIPGGGVTSIYALEVMNDGVYFITDENNGYKVYKKADSSWVVIESEKNIFRLAVAENKLYGISQSSILEYKNTPGVWSSEDDGLIASTPVIFPVNENLIFSGSGSEIWKTTDKGSTWHITELGFKGFAKQGEKLFGWSGEGIFTSVNGIDWMPVSNSIPPNLYGYISSLTDVNGVLYAGINKTRARMHLPPVWEAGGFYRSADNGLTWQLFSTGLPAEGGVPAPVYKVIHTPQGMIVQTLKGTFMKGNNENALRAVTGLPENEGIYDAIVYNEKLFIQTFAGIRYSTDFGVSWVQINEGLPSDMYFAITCKLFSYKNKLYIMGNLAENDVYELNGSSWALSEFPAAQGLTYNRIINIGDYLFAATLERGVWIYSPVSDIENDETTVSDYALNQNYPNPFNPSTTISFTLKEDAVVTMQIFSANGELVETLVSGYMSRGKQTLVWNASDKTSGVYITVLKINETATGKNVRLSNKMILMK